MTHSTFSAHEALTLAAQAEQQFQIGQRLFACGEIDKAAERFRATLAINPNHVRSHGELARVLKRQGRLKEAIAEADRALQLAPEHSYYLYLKGTMLASKNQWKQAQALVERSIELDPHYAPAHVILGSITHRANRIQYFGGWTHLHRQAEAHVRRALELNPNDVSAHRVLASILESLKQHEEAKWHYEKALGINPEDPLNHTLVATVYLNDSKPERAVEHLSESLRYNPTDKHVQRQLESARASLRWLHLRCWFWNLFFGRLPQRLRVPVAVCLIPGLVLLQDKVQHSPIESLRPYHEVFLWILFAYIFILACIGDWFAHPPRQPGEDKSQR
jgi:tetratricopeptide (TPR) repeat protein